MKIGEIQDNSEKEELIASVRLIRKDCSYFINSTLKPIYRGSDHSRAKISEVPIRTNRKTGSSEAGANCFNMVVERKFGIQKIKNSSLFCTLDYDVAESFGKPHYIFPKNDSKILSLEGVQDSIVLVNDMSDNFKRLIDESSIADSGSRIYRTKTLKEAEAFLNKEQYAQLENILDRVFRIASMSIDFKLITPSEFHTIGKVNIDTELMIFNSSSLWSINADNLEYSKILGILKGTK